MRPLRSLFLLFPAAVVSSTLALGATWVVDPPAGGGDFTSIKPAINAVSMFDTILVRPGIYEEELKIMSRHSGIVLRGDGPA